MQQAIKRSVNTTAKNPFIGLTPQQKTLKIKKLGQSVNLIPNEQNCPASGTPNGQACFYNQKSNGQPGGFRYSWYNDNQPTTDKINTNDSLNFNPSIIAGYLDYTPGDFNAFYVGQTADPCPADPACNSLHFINQGCCTTNFGIYPGIVGYGGESEIQNNCSTETSVCAGCGPDEYPLIYAWGQLPNPNNPNQSSPVTLFRCAKGSAKNITIDNTTNGPFLIPKADPNNICTRGDCACPNQFAALNTTSFNSTLRYSVYDDNQGFQMKTAVLPFDGTGVNGKAVVQVYPGQTLYVTNVNEYLCEGTPMNELQQDGAVSIPYDQLIDNATITWSGNAFCAWCGGNSYLNTGQRTFYLNSTALPSYTGPLTKAENKSQIIKSNPTSGESTSNPNSNPAKEAFLAILILLIFASLIAGFVYYSQRKKRLEEIKSTAIVGSTNTPWYSSQKLTTQTIH